MEQRRLGRSGLSVSALGLGAFQVIPGFGVSEEEALAIFDLAAASGIDYVDTAPMYDTSETLLGRALAAHPDWDVRVSTKVGHFDPELGDAPYRDPDTIVASVERSRERLGLERIDVLMIHEHDWPQWGLTPDGRGPVVDALLQLRDDGVISYIGIGGWDLRRTVELIETGLIDVALVAGGYTLLDQPITREVLPAAARHDVGIVAGGAFGQGFVSGLLAVDREPIERMLREDEFQTAHPNYTLDRRTCERLLNLYDIADDLGISMPELTIRFLLSDARIHSHIAGARETAHLRANLASVEAGPFDAGVLARIERA